MKLLFRCASAQLWLSYARVKRSQLYYTDMTTHYVKQERNRSTGIKWSNNADTQCCLCRLTVYFSLGIWIYGRTLFPRTIKIFFLSRINKMDGWMWKNIENWKFLLFTIFFTFEFTSTLIRFMSTKHDTIVLECKLEFHNRMKWNATRSRAKHVEKTNDIFRKKQRKIEITRKNKFAIQ